MNKFKMLLIVLLCILLAGCDGERVEELENQVDQLENQIEYLEREIANWEDKESLWEQSLIWCDYCGESVPEDYIFDEEGENICPKCVYGAYGQLLDPSVVKCVSCRQFYWSSDGVGLSMCGQCGEEFGGECVHCGEMTPLWNSKLDFVLCSWCLADVYENEEMQDAMFDWLDR